MNGTPARDERRRGAAWRMVGLCASWTVLLAVLAVAMVTVVVPKVAGAVPLTVLSNSMAPGMPVGSLAVVRPTMDTLTGQAQTMSPEQIDAVNDVDGIEVGQVIVYVPEKNNDRLVIHRVTAVTVTSTGRHVFTTQGDNNSAADDPVNGYQVRAVLWYQLPWLGHVNNWVNTGHREIVAVVVAGAGYLWAVVLFARALRTKRTKRSGRSGRHRTPTPAAERPDTTSSYADAAAGGRGGGGPSDR